MQEQVFWEKGLCFSCAQCSACCRFDPGFVYLAVCDLERLCAWSGLDSQDRFITEYCRWVLQGDGYEYLCLKERKNYDCILWENGCRAYHYRPIQCSSYPFWDYLLISKERWDANATDCPGINCGKKYSAEDIRSFLENSEKNPIIRRRKKR